MFGGGKMGFILPSQKGFDLRERMKKENILKNNGHDI
jgi:hypothetical protein